MRIPSVTCLLPTALSDISPRPENANTPFFMHLALLHIYRKSGISEYSGSAKYSKWP